MNKKSEKDQSQRRRSTCTTNAKIVLQRGLFILLAVLVATLCFPVIDVQAETVTFTEDDATGDTLSFTRSVGGAGGATFTFSTIKRPDAESEAYLDSYGGSGLYAYDGYDSECMLIIEVQNGYTFDITQFNVNTGATSLSIDLTYGNDTTATSVKNLDNVTISGFSPPINDVKKVVLTASDYTTFQDINITDVKKPVIVTTNTANSATSSGAIVCGTVNANDNNNTVVFFEYGTTVGYGTTVSAIESPVTGSLNTSVSAILTGLAPNTTYHYRAVGTSAADTANGSDMTFITSKAVPTVTTVVESGVTSSSAILNGTVNANNDSTAVIFEYGTTVSYGTTVAAIQSPVTGSSNTSVSAALTGLVPNTTYYYRVAGTNSAGSTSGGGLTFTTAKAAPTVSTGSSSGVTSSGAILGGTVNANNDNTSVSFEYGTTTGYGTTVAAIQSPVSGMSNATVSKDVTGLTPGITYHYRVVGTNSGGTTNGADMTFTTSKVNPVITTWPTVSPITYGQTFQNAISGGSSSESGIFTIADSSSVPDVTVSPYSKTITFTPIDTTTYNIVTTTASIIVDKADASISAIICADKTYDGSALAPSASIVTGSGVIAYTYKVQGTYDSTAISTAPTSAGIYTVIATLPESSNYNAASTRKDVTISKADQIGFQIIPRPAELEYGEQITLGTSGGSGMGTTVTWSAIGCADVTSVGAVTVTGVGNVTITAIRAGDNNYNEATYTYSVTAGKADPIIGTVTASSIYVGDTLSLSNLSRTNSAVAGTLSWETNAAFDASSSGSKTATYSFIPTDTALYNSLTGQNVNVAVNTRKILAVAPQADITNKKYGALIGDLGLNANVNVTVQGISADITTSAAVTWSDYDSSLLTAQTLTGTINLAGNASLNNSGTLTASAIVTLQPLTATLINNVSAKIKIGSTDGTAILKSLVTSQFDVSVDTTATNAAGWTGFPSDYNTVTSGSIIVSIKYLAACAASPADVTIDYEVVNPSSLAYTTSSAVIVATDANNDTAVALLNYENSQSALTVQWPANTTGNSILANIAPPYATLPTVYVPTGTTYNFSQSYLGQTISQTVTVNEVKQTAPSLTIDYAAETIDTTTAMSYSTVSAIWVPCTANMSITPLLGQNVKFKTPAAGFYVDSDETTVVFPARAAAPTGINATINDSKTEINFLGLAALTTYEYSMDGTSYSDLAANGKLVSNYINSLNLRKKYVSGASIHSAAATVPVNFTMTFDSTSGSAVSAAYAVSGAAIAIPSAPTRSGYTFSGWNSASTGTGSAITFPYTISENVTVYATWTVYVAPSNNNSTNSTPTPQPAKDDFDVVVNGEKQEPAGTATESKQGDQTKTTVTLDEKKLDAILEKIVAPVQGEEKPVITVPVSGNSDIVSSELNGQNIKDMESKEVVLEIKTAEATYTLPAQQINIDDISEQIGKNIELKDIKVQIEIAKSTTETVKIVENSAKKGEFTIVAPPVDFTVTCTHGTKTIDVSSFNAYVERTVAIPEGIDPAKITTGIVVDPDGTVRHMPTKIIMINGKYFAKINSLTNSTYSVVWHPLEFKDAEKHWAEEEINDMGSRLIISGVGNDLFAPDKDITRAEFAAIIVKALGLKPGVGSNPFTDVKNNNSYINYIKTAAEYGIINGYGNGKFGPNDKITREHAMAMITKAMRITGLKLDFSKGEVEKLVSSFADANKSSNAAKLNIAACIKTGIMTERAGKMIAPKEYITRAEVAVMVRRLLQKSDLI